MSNQILEALLNRRSIRQYTNQPISEEILREIVKAGQQAASSINGQQISLVTIREKETLKKLATITGGQKHVEHATAFIIVVVDFNRVKTAIESEHEEIAVTDSIEGLVTGAIDAGITVNTLATAADSFGIGTTVIGAIRSDVQAVIDLLGLPQLTIPIIGLALGYPDMTALPGVKPRIATEAYAFSESYPENFDFTPYFEEYEKRMEVFRQETGHPSPQYSKAVTAYYGKNGRPRRDTKKIYKAQGFKIQ